MDMAYLTSMGVACPYSSVPVCTQFFYNLVLFCFVLFFHNRYLIRKKKGPGYLKELESQRTRLPVKFKE